MDTALGPYDALRRIAYLLERSRAGTYRVKAFRSAAATVLKTDPAELQSLAEAGTLTDLPGIGSSTEAVIRQALDGEIPEYLTSMEAKAAERERSSAGSVSSTVAAAERKALTRYVPARERSSR